MTQLNHYRVLGRGGLKVSPLCLGTMTFGTGTGWSADEASSRAIFDEYLEQGGNFIDTAVSYTNGRSESLLGTFMAGRREQLVLATKFAVNTRPGDPNAGGNHRKAIVQAVETSLKRLRTEYIDLYYLHMWEGRTPVEEIMRALDDLVRSGKVLYLGISNAPAWQVSRANMLAEIRGWTSFIALQMEYNLGQRTGERDLLPMARELGIGVLPWSPLAGGVFSGKYSRGDLRTAEAGSQGTRKAWMQQFGRFTERHLSIADVVTRIAREIGRTPAQVAIAWTLAQPGVTSTLLGSRTREQLLDNLDALTVELSPEHLQDLDRVSEIEYGFPHDFLAQVRASAIDGGAVITA
ncbi:MAG TPA: aldo/keto reductase [Ktedonosporobacter sp.]|nr:aldo/keto reductase [Ktedonosporobacter sp.]